MLVGSVVYSIKPTHKRQAPGANASAVSLVRRDYDEIPPSGSTEFGRSNFVEASGADGVAASTTFLTDPDVTVKYCPVHGTVMVPRSPAINQQQAAAAAATSLSNLSTSHGNVGDVQPNQITVDRL